MITVEYSETLPYSAADVFAALTDLEARSAWQTSLVEIHGEPAGHIMPATRIFELRNYMGHKTEITLIVSAYEPGRCLTLETPPDAPALLRESYLIEPLTDRSCHLVYHTAAGGIPRMFEGLARKAQTKELPQNVERLNTLLASRIEQNI